MRSMQIVEWGKPLELRRSHTPEPKSGEILLRVEACGVCHSDLHIRQGFFELGNEHRFPIEERGVYPPFTLGHEAVGTAIAAGPNAGNVELGKSYLIYAFVECGNCEPCCNNLPQICDRPQIIGTRINGAYSDYVIVPDAKYLIEHEGVESERACILACSGLTSFSALKKLDLDRMTEQDTLLIIGAGGLGLMAVCLARALCAARIVVADVAPEKLRAALDLGANAAVDSGNEDGAPKLLEIANAQNGSGVAATVDFVGLSQTMGLGLSVLRKGGQHIHVGLFGGAYSLSLPPLAFRMLRVEGSYVGTIDELRELVRLVRDGLQLPVPITTRRLEEAESALNDLQTGKVVGRIVLKP